MNVLAGKHDNCATLLCHALVSRVNINLSCPQISIILEGWIGLEERSFCDSDLTSVFYSCRIDPKA